MTHAPDSLQFDATAAPLPLSELPDLLRASYGLSPKRVQVRASTQRALKNSQRLHSTHQKHAARSAASRDTSARKMRKKIHFHASTVHERVNLVVAKYSIPPCADHNEFVVLCLFESSMMSIVARCEKYVVKRRQMFWSLF